jgi:hypothetical protein
MDKSKLPKQTRKSDETPWTPTHERKKLSDRAGSVGHGEESFWDTKHAPEKKSWAGDEVTGENFKGGKYPGTDKPAKHWRKRNLKWQSKTKGSKDEKEY